MGCCHPLRNSENPNHKSELAQSRLTGSFILTPGDFVKINKSPITNFYSMELTLGTGGYGEVRRATHIASNALRAIKSIVISDCGEEEIEKLMKEVSILKLLDHQNILKIYEVYQNKSKIFIVTELCTGGELFDRIKQMSRFSENQAAKYMLQIVSAVMHCHQRGIVHRDLKPENLLFENESPDASLKLIDFGTSRIINHEKKMKKLIGTYYYMAPEVIQGEYDEKCDVWSLGIILYILLSGLPPFNGRTDQEIASKIQNSPLLFQGTCWSTISDEAKTLIMKMLKKSPAARTTIEDVFNSPWLQSRGNNRVPDIELEQSSLMSLASFRTETKLQQTVYAYIVSQMLDSKTFTKLREVFADLDKNGDGLLSAEELECANEKFDFNIDVKEIMRQCDTDKNGFINYTEFLTATVNQSQAFSRERLKEVFRIFDKNKDGKLSMSELKSALGGDSKSDSMFRSMIQEADTNGDGEIDLDEFITHLTKVAGT